MGGTGRGFSRVRLWGVEVARNVGGIVAATVGREARLSRLLLRVRDFLWSRHRVRLRGWHTNKQLGQNSSLVRQRLFLDYQPVVQSVVSLVGHLFH